MLKNRKSQLSITMIITAIIGLIILVVIVLMLTGNLGAFGAGVGEAGSCATVCGAAGYDSGVMTTAAAAQTGGLIDSDKKKCKCE